MRLPMHLRVRWYEHIDGRTDKSNLVELERWLHKRVDPLFNPLEDFICEEWSKKQRSTKPKSSIKFAAAVKLRSPGVRRVFVLGGCNKNLLDDLRLYLDSVLWAISSLRYAGASPCITL